MKMSIIKLSPHLVQHCHDHCPGLQIPQTLSQFGDFVGVGLPRVLHGMWIDSLGGGCGLIGAPDEINWISLNSFQTYVVLL
jgi:hypothetical protein